jgi:hypothetical protein
MKLPPEILAKAHVEPPSTEEGWRVTDFPAVMALATGHELACIGGQFQFRGSIGIAEMYWLNADSLPRTEEEDWSAYVKRANAEVLNAFDTLLQKTDFIGEASKWRHIVEAMDSGQVSDPMDYLYFVAYFVPKTNKPNKSLEPTR